MHRYYATYYYIFVILALVNSYSNEVDGNLENDIATRLKNGNNTSLSRTRRYLVFPEGSSFQLVFDLAYPSIDGIGFYVFGNTAGLAWELPSTPIFLDKKFQKKEEPEPTTTMLPHLEHPVEYEHDDSQPSSAWDDSLYQDPSGWQNKADFDSELSYGSKFGQNNRSPVSSYSNPFDRYRLKGFDPNYSPNQYPVHYETSSYRRYPYRRNPTYSSNRRSFGNMRNQMGQKIIPNRNRMSPLDRDIHHNIHRITRRELYTKLEELFSALIKDGKICILKTICQVNQTPKGKGTLWEELLKTIFEVKPDDFYGDEDHYDKAANVSHNCDVMYPACEGNIISKVISTALKK